MSCRTLVRQPLYVLYRLAMPNSEVSVISEFLKRANSKIQIKGDYGNEKYIYSNTGMIDVNHTLVYYDHRTEGSKRGCYFNVNSTKTPASMRQVPMLDFVKEAFEMEKQKQADLDLHCTVTIDGYTDFIFLNRFGKTQNQSTLNKAIKRIIRDCNDEQFEKSEEPEVLLPNFSCHTLRHTFTTRMCEAGVNVKVIQDILGHTDISTTLNIYADVTKELRKSEFDGLEAYFNGEPKKVVNKSSIF